MTAPTTLLAMTGMPLHPAALGNATLIIIDAQNEYICGPLALPTVADGLQHIALLVHRARAQRAPIIHVRHMGRSGGAFDPDAPRGQIAEIVAADPAEVVIDKRLPNAFAGTPLHETLQGIGRRELIVTGFMTHMCVSSTVRAALDLNYRCTIPAAATATRALPGADEKSAISADVLQRASLAALADRFAVVVSDVAEIPD